MVSRLLGSGRGSVEEGERTETPGRTMLPDTEGATAAKPS